MSRRAEITWVGRTMRLHCSECYVILTTLKARRRQQRVNTNQPYYCRTCHPDRKEATV